MKKPAVLILDDDPSPLRIYGWMIQSAGVGTQSATDWRQPAAISSMFQFQLVAKRVRFPVNLDAINRAHLVRRSELLKVAMSVQGRTPEGEAQ